jgi:hypothetical protein
MNTKQMYEKKKERKKGTERREKEVQHGIWNSLNRI